MIRLKLEVRVWKLDVRFPQRKDKKRITIKNIKPHE